MDIAFILNIGSSAGGVQRRLTRVYNEICAENKDIKCDIIVRGCDINTALALLHLADCDVANFNSIYAFKSRLWSLAYVLLSQKYRIIHFYHAGEYNIFVQLVCKLFNKKIYILFATIKKHMIVIPRII